jgi:hypothetical protein
MGHGRHRLEVSLDVASLGAVSLGSVSLGEVSLVVASLGSVFMGEVSLDIAVGSIIPNCLLIQRSASTILTR